jgi:hypothetical protein
MEKIVSSSYNLSWDGWTVIERTKSDRARTSKDGVCVNGSWYIQKRFSPDRNGWSIPTRYVA